MQKNALDRELTDHLSLNTEKINTSIHVFNAKNNAFDDNLSLNAEKINTSEVKHSLCFFF